MKRSQPGAHSVLAAWLSALTTVTAVAQPPTPAAAPEADDPYRWLEDVQGERALAWVRQRKAESLALLQARPEYAAIRDGTLALLQSADKLPRIERHGDFFHNLWTDAANPRGLLRRTRLAGYRGPQPQWEFVLDIDALGRAENENRVFEGMDCLAPQARRCMLRLSRGGTDAVVAREFDTRRKAFVPGGFMLPEAKLRLDWRDADTLVVGSDFGTGTMTRSGYPRIARLWRRGRPLAQARTLFEGSADDVSASAWVDGPVQPVRMLARRAIDTWHGEVSPQRADGSWQRIETPPHASVYTQGPWLFVQPRQAWAVGDATHPAGSLLVTRLDAFLRCERRLQALFTPSATTFLSGYVVTQRHVIVNRLDNVAGRSVEWSMPQGQQCTWRQRALALVSAQSQGSIEVTRWAQPGTRHDALAHAYSIDYQGFLTPATLLLAQAGGDRRDLLKHARGLLRGPSAGPASQPAAAHAALRLRRLPAIANAVVRRHLGPGLAGARRHGRGGQHPRRQRVRPGLAPAALKADRQKSYDDCIAVAEDLVQSGITTPAQLGRYGGSNGGLLVAAVAVQRPALFGAVVSAVPLLDMRRHHRLLAGASWMGEYGNPDLPDARAHLQQYSPYHNIRAGAPYPRLLFTTSTRDDRVHPAHARKMVARLQGQGHPALCFENTEGGHGGAADLMQRAELTALPFAYLWMQFGTPTPPKATP
jgi:prolyl oligopeptidase